MLPELSVKLTQGSVAAQVKAAFAHLRERNQVWWKGEIVVTNLGGLTKHAPSQASSDVEIETIIILLILSFQMAVLRRSPSRQFGTRDRLTTLDKELPNLIPNANSKFPSNANK